MAYIENVCYMSVFVIYGILWYILNWDIFVETLEKIITHEWWWIYSKRSNILCMNLLSCSQAFSSGLVNWLEWLSSIAESFFASATTAYFYTNSMYNNYEQIRLVRCLVSLQSDWGVWWDVSTWRMIQCRLVQLSMPYRVTSLGTHGSSHTSERVSPLNLYNF